MRSNHPDYPAKEWPAPLTEKPWQWAERSVRLKQSPFGDRINTSLTPWIRRPLERGIDNRVRELTCVCAVQGAKTTIIEILAAWAIRHQPGPMQINCQTDDDAKDFARERFNPILDRCDGIREKLPVEKGTRSTCAVSMPDMFLLIQGANVSNLQSKSIRWQFNDEVWLWKPGLLEEARKRTTQWWNRRIVNVSTAGEPDSDIDEAFRLGTMDEWHLLCPECGKLSCPQWKRIVWETSEDTKPGGIWDYEKMKASVRYECEHCGARHVHTDRAHKLMIGGGDYIRANPSPVPGHESFHWNALTFSPSVLSWADLAVEFVRAMDAYKLGQLKPLREFMVKRLAERWEEFKLLKAATVPEVDVSVAWPGEIARFMAVDVQEIEFWAVVRAWGDNESRLLWAGRLDAWDDVEAKQREFSVGDSCVFVDSSYDTRNVYMRCARHNQLIERNGRKDWVGWKALNGEESPGKSFTYRPRKGQAVVLPFSWPAKYVDPLAGKQGKRVGYCKLFMWANDLIKDQLVRLRDGKAENFKWLAYEKVPQTWKDQMFSEKHFAVVDKHGQETMRWTRIGQRANHLWDCEAMQLVAANMRRLVGEFSPAA